MKNNEQIAAGRAELFQIATNPVSMGLVEEYAKSGHGSVRDIPLMHQPGSKKAHPTGLGARLAIDEEGPGIDLTLIPVRGGSKNFKTPPIGGAWTIMCAGCPAEIVRKQAGLMLDLLKVLASRGTTREARSVTLR